MGGNAQFECVCRFGMSYLKHQECHLAVCKLPSVIFCLCLGAWQSILTLVHLFVSQPVCFTPRCVAFLLWKGFVMCTQSACSQHTLNLDHTPTKLVSSAMLKMLTCLKESSKHVHLPADQTHIWKAKKTQHQQPLPLTSNLLQCCNAVAVSGRTRNVVLCKLARSHCSASYCLEKLNGSQNVDSFITEFVIHACKI